MKKRILSLLLMILACIYVQAQTKSQVISDAIYTMEDFTSDLNFINDEKGSGMDGVNSMSHAFASAEYFMYNGKKMESFQKWLEEYCFQGLAGQYVEHSIDILQKTFEKVDEDEKNDKRYRFDALLTRRSDDSVNDEKTVTFIVEWKGNSQYVSILEIKGELFGQNRAEKVKVIQDDKDGNIIQQMHSEKSSWTDGLLSSPYFYLVLFVIAMAVLVYFVPSKGYGWIISILAGGMVFFFAWINDSTPSKLDDNIAAQYDDCYKVDSLKVAAVCKDNNWGLIDYKGEVLLPLEYQNIGAFVENMTWIQKEDKIGYINNKGEVKISPQYVSGRRFYNGQTLVRFKVKEGDITYYHGRIIDRDGNTVRDLSYVNVQDFNGRCAIVYKEKKYGVINDKGYREIIPVVYDKVEEYKDGYIRVMKDKKWGLYDGEGNLVLPVKYKRINIGKGDKIIVQNISTPKWCLIDLQNDTTIPFDYDYITFNSGWNAKEEKTIEVQRGRKYGLCDIQGNIIQEPLYDFISLPIDGLIRVRNNWMFGFLDENGKKTIPLKYEDASNFSGGLAMVRSGKKWGGIDRQGKTIIPFEYEKLTGGGEGLIAAKKNGKYGYISQMNETIIPFQFTDAQLFVTEGKHKGTAKVGLETGYGVINTKGETVIPCIYQDIIWDSGYYKAKKKGKWGILNIQGSVLVDFMYSYINIIGSNAHLTNDKQTQILKLQ